MAFGVDDVSRLHAAVVEQHLQAIHTEEVFLHVGALQQLFDSSAVLSAVEGFVQPVLANGLLQGRASRHTIEMVDDETQLAVTVVGHVGTATFCRNQAQRLLRLQLGKGRLLVVGDDDDLLAIITGNVVIEVAIEVADGVQGEIDGGVVAAQVDAVLPEVKYHRRRGRRQFLATIAHEGSTVVIENVGSANARSASKRTN